VEKYKQKRYIIFAACFITHLCIGVMHMWSVYQQHAVDFYGWASSQVSYTYSIMVGSFVIGGFIGGKIQDRVGPRRMVFTGALFVGLGYFMASVLRPSNPYFMLYLLFAFPVGFGIGSIYSPLISCVQKWFPDKKGFATGFTVCAFGLSIVVFSPIAEHFLNTYTFPATMRIMGSIILVVSIFTSFFLKVPPEGYNDLFSGIRKTEAPLQKQYTTTQMVRTKAFWLIMTVGLLGAPVYFIINPTLRVMAEHRGLTPGLALSAVMIMGMFSTLGRFVTPTISDRTGRIPMLVLIAVSGLAASCLLIFANGPLFLLAVCITGFSFGSMPPIHSSSMSDLFGTEHSGGNYGLFMLISGLPSMVYPAIVNALLAAMPEQRAYVMAFIGAIAVYIVEGVVVLFLPEPVKVASGEITVQKQST